MPPLLDPLRLEELRRDVGEDVLLALIDQFLATDYETPLHTLATQSAEQRHETLHGLKGVAANMGALALFALARDLMGQASLTEADQEAILAVLRETRGAMGAERLG